MYVWRIPNQTRIRKENVETRKGYPSLEDKTRLGGIITKPFRAALRSLGEGAATRSKASRLLAVLLQEMA